MTGVDIIYRSCRTIITFAADSIVPDDALALVVDELLVSRAVWETLSGVRVVAGEGWTLLAYAVDAIVGV